MQKVSIIGFGRFGKTLFRLIKDDFEVKIFDSNIKAFNELESNDKRLTTNDLSEVYSSEVIFYAVPISEFEDVIKSHKKYFRENQLLIDVLSVKVHPKTIFEKYLKETKSQALLTHPMFGPDSSKDGFAGLPIILDKFKASNDNYKLWKNYFESKKLSVVEMCAKTHDKIAASTQGLTHFVGRLLEENKFKGSSIDSLGTKKLLEIKEQTNNDTRQLFMDLQHFNPYTKAMRLKLGKSFDNLYNKILPKRISNKFLTIGIQGGIGSFNEEAIQSYIKEKGILKYRIKYLYTSERVLSALHKGEIDLGQFAIHNLIGGIVGESIDAMARYKFKIVNQLSIKISHTMMIRNDANFGIITTIMSHPQVFAQCKTTLSAKYRNLKQLSGKEILVDHAMVAKRLSEKKLPKNIAVMGSKVLAQIYDLKIVEENLQDAKENYTSFLQVSRN